MVARVAASAGRRTRSPGARGVAGRHGRPRRTPRQARAPRRWTASPPRSRRRSGPTPRTRPRASSMAGARTSARDSRPKRAWASPHDRTAPGTVIGSGPRRGIVRCPAARIATGSAAAGARPEPLRASWRPVAASQMSQNASPPMPQAQGITTPRTALVAMAASTAEPPARRMPRPAAVARWCGATTAPVVPRASATGAQAGRRSRRRFSGEAVGRTLVELVLLGPQLGQRDDRDTEQDRGWR